MAAFLVNAEWMDPIKHDFQHNVPRAISSLPTVAYGLTPTKTRQLTFFLAEMIHDRRGDTDLLILLAAKFSEMLPLGGPSFVHMWLSPLETLSVVDDCQVRNSTARALGAVARRLPCLSCNFFRTIFLRLCNHEQAAARLSAVALISLTRTQIFENGAFSVACPCAAGKPVTEVDLYRAHVSLCADNNLRVRQAAHELLSLPHSIDEFDSWWESPLEGQPTASAPAAQDTRHVQANETLEVPAESQALRSPSLCRQLDPFGADSLAGLGTAITKTLFTKCSCTDARFTRQTAILAVWMALFFYAHTYHPHSSLRHAMDTLLFWVGGVVFNVVLYNSDMIGQWIAHVSSGFASKGNLLLRCNICDHEKHAVVFAPCGHTCCRDCSAMIGTTCPYCRETSIVCIPIFH